MDDSLNSIAGQWVGVPLVGTHTESITDDSLNSIAGQPQGIAPTRWLR
jgi:hypothetical protein